jgi:hypothetical protein
VSLSPVKQSGAYFANPASGSYFPSVKTKKKKNISQESTVMWSNFDRLDPKMGVFMQSTEATPCGHLLK